MNTAQRNALQNFSSAFGIHLHTIVAAFIVADRQELYDEFGLIADDEVAKVRQILNPLTQENHDE